MLDDNNVVAFNDDQITNNSPIISADDVRQQIDLLDKAEGSRKNIKAGFNRMLQLGLIQDDQLQEQFGSTGFPSLLLDVKRWVSQNNSNKQWPSFLNDIKQAVSSFTFRISEESSFAETIRFFAYRKLGPHLSDKKIVSEIVAHADKSIFPKPREIALSYYGWLRGVDISSRGKALERLRFLDDFLCANEVIFEKGYFLVSLNSNKGQNGKKTKKLLELPEKIKGQFDAYSNWKISYKKPANPKQFNNLDSKQKRIIKAVNASPWTLNSDGFAGRAKSINVYIKSAFTFHKESNQTDEFTFNTIFEPDFMADICDWFIEKETCSQAIMYLQWIISEASPKTFLAHYCIPDDVDSYHEWLEEISFLNSEAKDLLVMLKNNKVALDGKRNVKFIINDSDPWSIYFDLIKAMKKIVIARKDSLWCHASYLAFRWMIYAPIRIRNISMLKWLGNVTERDLIRIEKDKGIGIFRLIESGEFGVFVHKRHLKNKKSTKTESIFQVFTGMSDDFERYLSLRKKTIETLGIQTEFWAFGVTNRAKEGIGGRVRPTHVGNELVKISQQALNILYPNENHPGVNPHGMRHLAATLFLNDNPDNHTALATLLMDNLDTVVKVYAQIDNKKNSKKISTWANARMTNAI